MSAKKSPKSSLKSSEIKNQSPDKPKFNELQ